MTSQLGQIPESHLCRNQTRWGSELTVWADLWRDFALLSKWQFHGKTVFLWECFSVIMSQYPMNSAAASYVYL